MTINKEALTEKYNLLTKKELIAVLLSYADAASHHEKSIAQFKEYVDHIHDKLDSAEKVYDKKDEEVADLKKSISLYRTFITEQHDQLVDVQDNILDITTAAAILINKTNPPS